MESYVFVLFVVYMCESQMVNLCIIYIDDIEFSIGLDFFYFPCPTVCIWFEYQTDAHATLSSCYTKTNNW